VVEGRTYKQQRKIMNPAFAPPRIRELTEIFIAKSVQLQDIWAADNANLDGISKVDAFSWLGRTTLDMIGLAGFNHNLGTLNDDHQNELHTQFTTMLNPGAQKRLLIGAIKAHFPFLRFLHDEKDVKFGQARETMLRIGNQLLQESKASLPKKTSSNTRNLFSLLVRSNMMEDLPNHQRMNDQEVVAQVPTYLVAASETARCNFICAVPSIHSHACLMSIVMTWALYELTQDKAIQEKLHRELLAVDTDCPTMDQLNALPYLEMVVRETMRLHAPLESTLRAAVKDDILPLNNPVTDQKGVVHDTISLRKGQMILIPILVTNRQKPIWGQDAAEFRPERWKSIPVAAREIPGVWGNMLTFLDGPRACIGYRFALVQMKALLFTLVRAFEFDLAVPAKDIVAKTSITHRPTLVNEGVDQMPLLIRPVVRT